MPVANWKRATSGRAAGAHAALVPPLQLSYHSKIWSNRFEKSQERICISFSLQRKTLPFIGHFTGRRITLPAVASRPHLAGARKETRRPFDPAGIRRNPAPLRVRVCPWPGVMRWHGHYPTIWLGVLCLAERKLGFQSSSGLTLIKIKKWCPKECARLVHDWLGGSRSSRFRAKSENKRGYKVFLLA